MIGTTVKILFGLIIGIALVIAVLFALGADLIAHDTRPKLRRRVRNAGTTMRQLQEAHT